MPRYYDDRSDLSPPRRRGGTRVAEYEDIEIHEHRRRDPDFLREDYGRNPNAGPLVIRDEEIIEERSKSRGGRRRRGDAEREREVLEEEVIVARSGNRDRDRERERRRKSVVEEEEIRIRRDSRPVEREEVVYRPKERRVPASTETEEWVYRPRERSPPAPVLAREVEEWRFAPPPRREPAYEQEEITIRERERGPPPRDYREEEITIRERERERGPPPRDYREEEITIRERERERGPPLRDYREEEITIRERERDRGPPRDYRDEEITIRERERAPTSNYRDEEIMIRERESSGPGPRDRGDYRDEEIRIRERESGRPRDRGYHEDELIIRRSSNSPSRERQRPRRALSVDREEISYRRDERDRRSDFGGRDRDRGNYKDQELIIRRDEGNSPGDSKEEIVIRRREREPEPEPEPQPVMIPMPPPEPEPIRAPPIHQEIITHHRHIDHGFETYRPPVSAPMPAPPPPARVPTPPRRSPSPARSTYDEIEIRRREQHNGHRHDDDIMIRRRASSPQRPAPSRRRSLSVDTRTVVARRPDRSAIDEEAEFYARKNNERAYIGEAYNGATQNWSIVDVPPGTNRVRMDGVGGGSQEITWQRYNGVRRSKFIPESDGPPPAPAPSTNIERRKYVGARPKTDSMWTEITKDLVVREAIERLGYEFEETEFFYYVMEYLRYEDVLRLVRISEDIRSSRRKRIRQIEWEKKMPPEPPRTPRMIDNRGWEEERERIVEREYYERRSPRDREREMGPFPRPPMPPPMPSPGPPRDRDRIVEREKVVVIR